MASKTKRDGKTHKKKSEEINTSKVNNATTLTEEKSGLAESWKAFIKWAIFGAITGVVVGLVGIFVVKGIGLATSFRKEHSWIIFLMPVAGLLSVFLYRINKKEKDTGTNAVLGAIRNQNKIYLRTAPLIITSTILTHLVGGSAGREGAALQFGGALGEGLGRLFKFNEKDRTIIIMCGVSAAFSAVFGVPIGAVVFPIEVVSVGIMYYSALVPCTISSMVAHEIARFFGLGAEAYPLEYFGHPTVKSILVTVVLSILCGFISSVFCEALHNTHSILEKKIPNQYIRVLVGSAALIVLTLIFGTDYNGAGTEVIERALTGGLVVPWAFLVKMIFTVITLSIGFKGGEIVPSFFIGATLGALVGSSLGFNPELCASIGMIGVFCGVTNTPIASLIIACELFGFEYAEYYLIAVGITYLISGYKSLYSSQKIVYAKTEPTFVNKEAE